MSNLALFNPAIEGPFDSVDKQLAVLEIMTVDVSGRLVRSKVRTFRTVRSIDVEEVRRVTDNART